jgi:hypothetical protein
MKHIKEYNQFVVNEEEGLFKSLLLSAMLAIGINRMDAQTIQQDSAKTEVVKNISSFNKAVIYNIYPSQVAYDKLKRDLSLHMNEPDLFIDKYLRLEQNGTLIVKPNFIEGLELHLNKSTNTYGVGYNFKF